MKVLFINTFYYPNVVGGAERSVQFLAETLVKKGHEAIVLSIDKTHGIRTDRANGVKIYYIGIKNIYWPLEEKNRSTIKMTVWHMLDTLNQPDVVHTNNLGCFSVAIWEIVKRHHLPLVHTIRDCWLLCIRGSMFRNDHNCKQQCFRCTVFSYPRKKLSKYVDIVVGVSRFILNKHISMGYFCKSQKKVIFNSYEPKEQQIIRPFEPNNIRFGYIGRLTPEKGVKLILDEFSLVKKDNITLTIAGTSHDKKYIQYLKNKSGKNVTYIGFVNPEEFYSNIDILIVPSLWHEPLGRIVFEAYAHGVPVIGSNRGGIPEIIDSGKTGMIFDPDTPGELQQHIQWFMDNIHNIEVMRRFCIDKSKMFLPDEIIRQYIEVYKHVLNH